MRTPFTPPQQHTKLAVPPGEHFLRCLPIRMKTIWLSSLTLCLSLGAGQVATAQVVLTVIDVPGAAATDAWGINNAGQVVGSYTADGATFGFVLDRNILCQHEGAKLRPGVPPVNRIDMTIAWPPPHRPSSRARVA